LTTTAHCITAMKKACHIKAYQTYSEHIFPSDGGATQTSQGAEKLYPLLMGLWTNISYELPISR